jgi:hypothetical protein
MEIVMKIDSHFEFNSSSHQESFPFLAYFQILKKYAIVRTLSVRLSVPLLLFRGLTDLARLWLNR